jgi:hypothetical protein
MGGRSPHLSKLAVEVWKEVIRKNSFLLPSWVATQDNTEADMLSRENHLHWDFSLQQKSQEIIFQRWFLPSLDAFASRTCHVTEKYLSWFPDNQSQGRDALAHPWPQKVFLFPPVPLISKVLNKLRRDRVSAILIAPNWTSAIWFPNLLSLTQDFLLLGDQSSHLIDPRTNKSPEAFLSPLAAWLLHPSNSE